MLRCGVRRQREEGIKDTFQRDVYQVLEKSAEATQICTSSMVALSFSLSGAR